MVQRVQHPVGQGLFHSSTFTPLGSGRNDNFRMVYDCGSFKYGGDSKLARQIDQYRDGVADEAVDLLVISHTHLDHVSGLPRLFAGPGSKPRIVLLPYVSAIERLLIFAASDQVGEDAESDFIRALTVNPTEAFRSLGAERVLYVQSGNEQAQPDEGTPAEDPGDAREEPRPEPDGTIAASDAGSLALTFDTPPHVQYDGSEFISDRVGIQVSGNGMAPWILKSYVDPAGMQHLDDFHAALSKQLPSSEEKLEKRLDNHEFLASIITENVRALRSAYKKIAKDVNLTSLSLYAGPSTAKQGGFATYMRGTSWSRVYHHAMAPKGWLGTGDAALRNPNRRSAFLAHYSDHLRDVGTLLLPHHGSDANFHSELLSRMRPNLAVVSSAQQPPRGWEHPGSELIREALSSGANLQHVSELPESILTENFVHVDED